MKNQIAVLLCLFVLVGCGDSKEEAAPKTQPKLEAKKTEQPKAALN